MLLVASATVVVARPRAAVADVSVVVHADFDGRFAAPSCDGRPARSPDYAAFVASVEKERAASLVLLGGNFAAPALFARSLAAGEKGGGAVAALLGHARYDAVALGHQELSLEPRALQDLLRGLSTAGEPVVATNLRCAPARAATCALTKKEVVVVRGGARIGVVATLHPDVASAIAADRREGLSFDDPATSVRAAVRRLRGAGATTVVLLTQGPRDARALPDEVALVTQLAAAPHEETPDLVFAGGLASGEDHPPRLLLLERAPPIVATSSPLMSATRVALPVAAVPVVTVLPPETTAPNLEVARALAAAATSYCASYGRPVTAQAPRAPLDREAFTKIVLDVMRRRAHTEIAILNQGAVRGAPFLIDRPITMADLGDALPYEAVIGVADVAGANVENALAPALQNRKARLVGLEKGAGGLEVNGRALDKARGYRVATISFVAKGGDGLVPPGALAWAPLPGDPDLRDTVEADLRAASAATGPSSFDVASQLGSSAKERLLVVGLADADVDLADTTISNAAGYDDSQLGRGQQTSLQGTGTGLLQLRLPRHQEDTRLELKYGWARTQAAGAGAPVVSAETADRITFTSLYSYRGLRSLRGPPKIAIPDPYARLWVESELTRPAVTPTQPRAFHHLQTQGTLGAVFTLTSKLQVRAGGGARREVLATGDDGRWQSVLEAGLTLDPTALATFGNLAIKLEGLVDYTFVDPRVARDSELRATAKLSIPLVPRLFLSAGLEAFGVSRQGQPWAAAYDTTIGLRVHFDAASQRL